MQRVLVTGGTGTLGSALTRELCAGGHDVVATFASNRERATHLREQTGCALWQGDLRDEEAVGALFTAHQFTAVVHLAGASHSALVARTSPEEWRDVLAAHLDSSFLVTRAALEYLPSGGQLLLVSSRVGLRGSIGQSAYGAAKAGVLGLMRTAAIEGGERGVRVNALCPGYAPTPDEALSPRTKAQRALENVVPDSDAAQALAAFVQWFLTANSRTSGQVLRPDCRL